MTTHATHNEYVNCVLKRSTLARPGLSYSQAASGGGISNFKSSKTRLIGSIVNSTFTPTFAPTSARRAAPSIPHGVLMSHNADSSNDNHSRSNSRELSSRDGTHESADSHSHKESDDSNSDSSNGSGSNSNGNSNNSESPLQQTTTITVTRTSTTGASTKETRKAQRDKRISDWYNNVLFDKLGFKNEIDEKQQKSGSINHDIDKNNSVDIQPDFNVGPTPTVDQHHTTITDTTTTDTTSNSKSDGKSKSTKNHVKIIIVENVNELVVTSTTIQPTPPTKVAQINDKNIQNQAQNPPKRAQNYIQSQNQNLQHHVQNQNLKTKQKHHQIVLLKLMIYIN